MHLGKVECAYLRQGFITGLDEGTPVLMNLILFFLFRGGGFRCLKIKSENMFFGKTHSTSNGSHRPFRFVYFKMPTLRISTT